MLDNGKLCVKMGTVAGDLLVILRQAELGIILEIQMNHALPVIPSVKKNTLTVEIDSMLNVQKTWDAVIPYFLNGGKCGHKVMDVKGAVDALHEADTTGKLKAFKNADGSPINDFKMGNALKNVIRGRLHLNSRWKADGVNSKIAEANPDLAKMFADFLQLLENNQAEK